MGRRRPRHHIFRNAPCAANASRCDDQMNGCPPAPSTLRLCSAQKKIRRFEGPWRQSMQAGRRRAGTTSAPLALPTPCESLPVPLKLFFRIAFASFALPRARAENSGPLAISSNMARYRSCMKAAQRFASNVDAGVHPFREETGAFCTWGVGLLAVRRSGACQRSRARMVAHRPAAWQAPRHRTSQIKLGASACCS